MEYILNGRGSNSWPSLKYVIDRGKQMWATSLQESSSRFHQAMRVTLFITYIDDCVDEMFCKSAIEFHNKSLPWLNKFSRWSLMKSCLFSEAMRFLLYIYDIYNYIYVYINIIHSHRKKWWPHILSYIPLLSMFSFCIPSNHPRVKRIIEMMYMSGTDDTHILLISFSWRLYFLHPYIQRLYE